MLYIKKIFFFFVSLVIFLQVDFVFAEETYDPFADYNEFSIIKEAEQDINFFNDGRFISLGVWLQNSQPTGNLDQIYGGATGIYVFMTYFFDLRFALQFTLGYQDHIYQVSGNNVSLQSSSSFRNLAIGIKYYVNPDRIIYALSKFNPYLIVGVGLTKEQRGAAGDSLVVSVSHTVYNFITGFELPLPGKKFFLHAQAGYHFSSSFGQEDLFQNKTGNFISGAAGIGLNF